MIKSLLKIHAVCQSSTNKVAKLVVAACNKSMKASINREVSANATKVNAINCSRIVAEHEAGIQRGLRKQIAAAQRLCNA